VADYSGLLAAALGGSIPELPGARCRGLAPAWDLPGVDPAIPARICRRCPALLACTRWADAQPPGSLHGVIAGRKYRYVAHPSLRHHADGLGVAW
jgi:hypothetical protein